MDLEHRLALERIAELARAAVEPHRMPVRRIGRVTRRAADREALLEHQHVAGLEMGARQRADEVRHRRAGRQPAGAGAPAVQGEFVLRLIERRHIHHGLEHPRPCIERLGEPLGIARQRLGQAAATRPVGAGQQHGAGRHQRWVGLGAVRIDRDAHEGAGVAALAGPITEQPRMPPSRGAQPGPRQIGLGAHRVLVVAREVGPEGQRFDQGDAEIRGAAFSPARHGHRHAIDHQPPEALVILGEVVDRGRRRRLRQRRRRRQGVEIGRAIGLERELDQRQRRIETGGRRVEVAAAQHQPVAREIAGPVEAQPHRLGIGARSGGDDLDADDPDTALDGEVLPAQIGHAVGPEEHHVEQPLPQRRAGRIVIEHFEVIEPVEAQPADLHLGAQQLLSSLAVG
ncbi:hypothetical protein [Mesorhizobium sp. M8A.F.Ca.ET.057.01.1.1]|uniref:hypothetical protein n=1 Tax=Mesorhizobium sp. M8A.F.Ca.ET.057.01.1.1 TaxID=2493679 RepID=UPI001ABF2E2E|nr:hypothetical protein [Mesorhizobium sp. M8A.F.Ca.ET.057.01.1.1]